MFHEASLVPTCSKGDSLFLFNHSIAVLVVVGLAAYQFNKWPFNLSGNHNYKISIRPYWENTRHERKTKSRKRKLENTIMNVLISIMLLDFLIVFHSISLPVTLLLPPLEALINIQFYNQDEIWFGLVLWFWFEAGSIKIPSLTETHRRLLISRHTDIWLPAQNLRGTTIRSYLLRVRQRSKPFLFVSLLLVS